MTQPKVGKHEHRGAHEYTGPSYERFIWLMQQLNSFEAFICPPYRRQIRKQLDQWNAEYDAWRAEAESYGVRFDDAR